MPDDLHPPQYDPEHANEVCENVWPFLRDLVLPEQMHVAGMLISAVVSQVPPCSRDQVLCALHHFIVHHIHSADAAIMEKADAMGPVAGHA